MGFNRDEELILSALKWLKLFKEYLKAFKEYLKSTFTFGRFKTFLSSKDETSWPKITKTRTYVGSVSYLYCGSGQTGLCIHQNWLKLKWMHFNVCKLCSIKKKSAPEGKVGKNAKFRWKFHDGHSSFLIVLSTWSLSSKLFQISKPSSGQKKTSHHAFPFNTYRALDMLPSLSTLFTS